MGATKSTVLTSNSSVLIVTPALPTNVYFPVGIPLSTVKARDGALAAKAVLTGALAGSEKLNAPVVPLTGPRATETTGPPTYCFVTPATHRSG